MLQNTFYILGGDGASGGSSEVWKYSINLSGAFVWIRVTVAGNEFFGRAEHTSAVLDNAISVISGAVSGKSGMAAVLG